MYTNQMFEDEMGKKASLLKKYHFDEEEQELHSGFKEKTGFPKPEFFQRLMVEAINLPVEEAYFWMLDELRDGHSFNKSVKITDISAAAESSSFFGVMEQRMGLQQDKASQYLKGISEMLKALFQIVREIRIIDERIGYYHHTFNRKEAQLGKDEEASGSEITLKGIWVDQVEGGSKNAASVYGLAATVGFSVLPDLFFRVRADDRGLDKLSEKESFDSAVKRVVSNVDKTVGATTGFNDKVKEVLGRKLTQYYVWKLRTFKELKTRRAFTLKYLRQHYDTIKLYMGWIRPYLRNIQRLQMAEKLVRKDMADLITAFEGALVEIETLLYKDSGHSEWKPVVLLYMYYRTRPSLSYVQEGYQRGPMHTGRFDMMLRGYVWHDDEIKNYQNMREVEDLELLGNMDVSIKQALESLGEELKDYLRESGEELEGDGKKKEGEAANSANGAAEPFTGVFAGLRELMSPLKGVTGLLKKKHDGHSHKKRNFIKDDLAVKEATGEVRKAVYDSYKNYKKMHGMMTW